MLGRRGRDHGEHVPTFGAEPVQLLDGGVAVVRKELGVTEDEDVVLGTNHGASVRPVRRARTDVETKGHADHKR